MITQILGIVCQVASDVDLRLRIDHRSLLMFSITCRRNRFEKKGKTA